VTLLNSRRAKVPPGSSNRCASRRTSGIKVTFRIPNAIVYSKDQGKGKKKHRQEMCVRTVVIHRLFEAHLAFLQHFSVNVGYVYARLTAAASFARVVKDAQRDVPRPTRDVDAADGSSRDGEDK